MKSSKKFLTRVLTAALALSMVAGTGICAAAVDEEETNTEYESEIVIAPAPEDEDGVSRLAALREMIEAAARSAYAKLSQSTAAQLVEIAKKVSISQKILADTYSQASQIQSDVADQVIAIMDEAAQRAAAEEDEEVAAQIIADAQAQVDQITQEVSEQVEQMLAEAEQMSAELLAEANEQLEAIKAQIQGRISEKSAALMEKIAEMQQKIEEVKAQVKEFSAKMIEAVISRTTKYETMTDGDYVYRVAYSLRGVSAAFIDYTGGEEEITVPAYINGIPVECIMFATKGVKSVTIPETVTSLDAVSFMGADDLENIYVDDANPYFQSFDGVVFDKSGTVLVAVPMAREYNAPEGTIIIGSRAYALSNMSEIEIPSTVEYIESNAFERCYNLESIDIPDSVTTIGSEAFKDCYSLKKVHIPASVEEMGEDVFTGCSVDFVIELDTVDCQAYIYAKTHEIPIKCPLTASFGLETEFIEDEEHFVAMPLGLSVKVEGYAEGGSDEGYLYAFYYRKQGDTKWSCKQSFKENDSVEITPKNAGLYEICVKVKDSKGNIAKMYGEVFVKETFENTSTVSAETIKKGEKVTVDCSANYDNVEFAVFYKKKTDTKWTKKQDYSDNTEVVIKPTAVTDYEICVKAKNLDDGTITKKYFDLTVTA